MKAVYSSAGVRVCEIVDADGDTQRLLYLGPTFANTQGGFKVNKPKVHIHQYSQLLTFGALCVPKGVESALFLGFGAGITIQAVRDLFPVATIDIVDLNPELFHVSQTMFFDIKASNVNLFSLDGYEFVKSSKQRYDYICCDIWAAGLEVPSFLLGADFYVDVAKRLSERGVFSINTQRAEHKTVSQQMIKQFTTVYSCQANNSILIASNVLIAPSDEKEVAENLLSTNLDIKIIKENLIIMHSSRNGICEIIDENAYGREAAHST